MRGPMAGVLGWSLFLLCGGCHSFRTCPVDYQSSLARELTYAGIDALKRGQSDEAERMLTDAVAAAPKDQRIRAEYSKALAQRGQMGRAIEQMRTATELSPHEEPYHAELGNLYLKTAQVDRALAEADRAIELDRQSAGAWLLRGRALRALGRLEQAKTDLHRSAAINPEQADVRFELAEIYFELRQPQRTLVILEGIHRDFDSDELPENLPILQGMALADVGLLDRAAEVLVQAIEAGQRSPRLYLQLSRVHGLRGDAANARLTLLRGRELFPDHPEFASQLEAFPEDPPQTASF
jgi:tetratricopeptide (TPR) repeat protein